MQFFADSHVTRKAITAFMDFFSDVSIAKYKYDGTGIPQFHKLIRVPIQFATTEKWLQVLKSGYSRKGFDPDLLSQNPVEIEWALPRMSVQLTGITYDTQRKVPKALKISDYDASYSTAERKNVFAPVPYNLEIDLTAITKNVNELFQIIEQIIPFFTPSLSLDIKVFDDKVSESVPIVLSSTSVDLPEETSEMDERIFTATFSFVMKTNYYLPKRIDKLVTNVTDNLFDDAGLQKFESYAQTAVLPAAVGDYPDRTNTVLNPVTVERT